MMDQEMKQHQRSSLTARTGHHAPTSGWWRPEDSPHPFRYLQEGEVMPPIEGSQVLWTLVQKLSPAERMRFASLRVSSPRTHA